MTLKLMYAIDFSSCKSAAALQSDGNEPKFCHIVVSFDMDMLRLVPITSVKECYQPDPISPERLLTRLLW
jgi:hypothetical protein